jgi:hypothetical protein
MEMSNVKALSSYPSRFELILSTTLSRTALHLFSVIEKQLAFQPVPFHEQVGFAGLAELLPKVAMEDKTVIITSVNEAWAKPESLLDLQRESFKNGEDIAHLLNHVLVIALDPAGFDHCKAVHPHCYLLELRSSANNLSSAERFMSKDYLELVWTKLTFQQTILELGYNFLFTVKMILQACNILTVSCVTA